MVSKKQFKFYGWVGLASLVLSLLMALHNSSADFTSRALNETWAACYLIFINYLFFESILPSLSRKHIGKSLLRIIGLLFLCSVGFYVWRGIGIGLHIYTSFAKDDGASHIVADQFGSSIGSLLFFGIIRHIYNHQQLKQTAQRLQIEKQAAELNYLKAQTNPHFLFNTLNNIYSLSRDKSDLAPESILRLSKILRYMLYETGGTYIAVEQELKIMNDYIALEKLRYDDSLHVNFNYNVEDMKQSLPPLLLIPLVENAFKHGVAETRHQPFVDIHLSISRRLLTFIVKNSSGEPSSENDIKEKIGLGNLRRQLELLYTDYKLDIQQLPNVFTATLKINLSTHV